MPRRALAFDVNETLLDLRPLDPLFKEAFGDAAVRFEWFGLMLQSAFMATATGTYADFGYHGRAALEMAARRRKVELSGDQQKRILGEIRTLPAYPDVRPGLERLRRSGFTMAALTNSTQPVAEAQLEDAGIKDLFDQVLSADTVKRLKPAPEPYRMAAERLGVSPADLRLVAAHAWDVAGALAAGCAAAFVERPGVLWNPLVAKPDVWGRDIEEVAAQIEAKDLA